MENQTKSNSDSKPEKEYKEEVPVNKSGWREKSLGQTLTHIRSYITVEPMLACYVMPSVLASLAVQNLNLEKACRVNKNYGDEICTSLIEQKGNYTVEEAEVQALVAYMTAWRLPLQTALPAIMILFVGAWSDRSGKRKPYMMVPVIGEFITAVGLILCTYYFLEWPLEVAGVIEGLPPSLTGGWAMMFMAIFSYIADHTSPEERTFRIGIVNVIISIGVPVGTALSGILLNKLGFYGVFVICLCIYVCGFIYGFFGIKENKVKKKDEIPKGTCCQEYFNLRYVYDTFMVLFKPRLYSRRMRALLVMFCYIIVAGPVHGTGSLLYLYARRQYEFNEVDFSIFSSYSIVMNLIGVLVGITFLSKYLKMDDSFIAILACISKVIASFVYAFAPNKYWFYLGPAIELIGGTAVIAIRSIATKVVEPDEVGKIISIFGVCDAIINSVYSPIFAAFYVHTITSFPGAFCILAALFTAPSIGVFVCMYVLQKRDKLNEEKEKISISGNDNTCELEITSL